MSTNTTSNKKNAFKSLVVKFIMYICLQVTISLVLNKNTLLTYVYIQ